MFTRSIEHYFPPSEDENIIALFAGYNHYKRSRKYILEDGPPCADIQKGEPLVHSRGRFLGDNRLYIDPALAAIMYATGKEPPVYDLNTPSNTYGWDFNETRDLLNRLNALWRNVTH